MKQTKSERVSDTVFFKTKFITQPTMTPADRIIKALNNLTQALKGKSNAKGLEQPEALKKLEDILNNTPETAPIPIESSPPDTRQVTFKKTKENKQNKLTAKNFKVNMIKEHAEAMEELIVALTENHTLQMETLIKSTTDTMKEMMSLIKNEQKAPNNQPNDEKKKKQEERRKWYSNAPICKQCGKKDPAKAEDECWEQMKNKDSRPSKWKSAKIT